MNKNYIGNFPVHEGEPANQSDRSGIEFCPSSDSQEAHLGSPFWRLLISFIIILTFWMTRYFGGNPVTFAFFLFFAWSINTQIFPFKKKFREAAINAILDPESSAYRFLMDHPTLIICLSYVISAVFSVSMMLFVQSMDEILHGFVLTVGGLSMYWLYKRSIKIVKRPFQDEAAVLIREYVVNAIGVAIMLLLFGIIYFTSNDELKFPIVLDPAIPLYVKDTVHHSSHLFQAILRFYCCIDLTMLNLAALNTNVLYAYKILHTVTANMLPIIGITLFFKCIFRFRVKE